MEREIVHSVSGKDYHVDMSWLGDNLLFGDFTAVRSEPKQQFNVFADCWVLLESRDNSGDISFKVGDRYEKSSGQFLVLIPPFSIVDWQLGTGEHHFYTYTSNVAPPFDWPSRPVLFSSAQCAEIQSVGDIFRIVEEGHRGVNLGSFIEKDHLACQVKDFIDEEFENPLRMSELARQLGYTRETLARSFKRSFGMSISNYRNWLRVSKATNRVVLEDRDVTSSAMDSGIEDSSFFSRKFKSLFDVSLREYRPDPRLRIKASRNFKTLS